MTKAILILVVIGISLLSACNSTKSDSHSLIYESENLIIEKLSEHSYLHTSFLKTEDFGKVSCNGLIAINEDEALIFDTPADMESSTELIDFLEKDQSLNITAVVATHFHEDCVGGLQAFHNEGIPSYANNATIQLVKEAGDESKLPQKGFDEQLELTLGNEKVYAGFYGEGHTKDNVIGYFPKDNILFGGCLIKEAGASEGNLEDANIKAWPESVEKIKNKYPETQVVIPGHGKIGGMELLDYTIALFQK